MFRKALTLLVALAMSVAVPVFAAAGDPPATIADLTSSVDFTTMAAGVLAIALVIINFKVIKQGALVVMRFVGLAK